MTYRTYTDDEYGYQVAYPAGWTIEMETPGGASFVASVGSAGAVVYVDERIDLTLAEYIAAFTDGLAADEYVRAIECLDRRDIMLESGETGRVVEYAYRNGMYDERWRLVYLFAVVSEIGYTLGIDWSEDDSFDDVATRLVESFAVSGESGDEQTRTNGLTE